jgi:hypothetical protein
MLQPALWQTPAMLQAEKSLLQARKPRLQPNRAPFQLSDLTLQAEEKRSGTVKWR